MLASSTAVANAQTVRGRLVSADSTRPISGAIVLLRDSSNIDVARTLSADNGSFTLKLPSRGTYRIRALLNGFQPGDYGPNRLGAPDDTTALLLSIADARISLAAIRIAGRRDCGARDKGGSPALVIWEEARKALLATVLTRTDVHPLVTLANYERVYDPRTEKLRSQTVQLQRISSTRPYTSPLPPDEYAAKGYVESDASGVTYRAPDADVLLSDSFAATHCFRVTALPDTTRLGLAFQPTKQRDGVIDVSGTLIIDRSTSELRSLDFRYAGLSDAATSMNPGGHMDFVRLHTGAWVIASWELNAPRIISVQSTRERIAGMTSLSPRSERDSIADNWKIGGEVLRVSVAGAEVWHGSPARVAARIVDGGDGQPIPNASVTLSGANYVTSTDSHGDFAINDILRGSYTLEAHSPALRALGVDIPTVVAINLTDTTTAAPTVRMLSMRAAIDRICRTGETPAGDTAAVIQGIVKSPGNQPVAGAIVVARWLDHAFVTASDASAREQTLSTTTASNGLYRLCGVPVDRTLHIVATHDHERSAQIDAQIDAARGLGVVDIALTTFTAAAADPKSGDEIAAAERMARDIRSRAGANGPPSDSARIARRRQGGGVYMSEEEITARNASSTAELLRTMRGVRVERGPSGGTIVNVDRGPATLLNQAACAGVAVFVSGSEMALPFDVDQIVPTSIRSIEFYSGPASTPPELRSGSTVCATLAIWTK